MSAKSRKPTLSSLIDAADAATNSASLASAMTAIIAALPHDAPPPEAARNALAMGAQRMADAGIPASAEPEPLPENPLCVERWPYADRVQSPAGWIIAGATEAALAVSTLAKVLHADARIAADVGNSDSPADEPQPLSVFVRDGLFSALHVCAHAVQECVESIEGFERKRAQKEAQG